MGGDNQNMEIIKPNGTTGQLRQCDLNFCDSAVYFGPEERVYTLSLKISQVIEFRVHKPSFFLTPTRHCHTPQSTTICKLSKPSCEYLLCPSSYSLGWCFMEIADILRNPIGTPLCPGRKKENICAFPFIHILFAQVLFHLRQPQLYLTFPLHGCLLALTTSLFSNTSFISNTFF